MTSDGNNDSEVKVTDHKALIELEDIIVTEGLCHRSDLFKEWINKWLTSTKVEQSVVHTKYLNSEFEDLLKYRLGTLIGETLAEECVEFDLSNTIISAEMLGIRRKAKKIKS